ncbi:histidine kinase dimerization/phospho-acceptor domain-containing protein [Streptomyces sp. NPDC051018]|uniref:histidine kinase dimerization/phospho-acceptor domain-containing protein n=1 Tax=Streptomyces sp. NPDC051018 TaxID=3365639 RepID=UPI00379518F6
MCCTLAALLGVLVHVGVTRQTVNESREKALGRLADASEAYEAGEPLPRFADVDPAGLPASLRALALSGEHGTMVSTFRDRPTMWAAGPADGSVIGARVDYTLSAKTITALDRAIVGSSVLAIGATLLVGAFAVTRITRRLHLTAQVARRISAGDLDARVGDPRTGDPSRPLDEVATVSGALDTMASSLQAKLLSEQRFTADVAHELRTPLTGLTAAAELLPPGRPAELVRDRVRAMRALTEDLLEISRLDAGSETVDLDMHELSAVAERVARAAGSAGPPGAPGGVSAAGRASAAGTARTVSTAGAAGGLGAAGAAGNTRTTGGPGTSGSPGTTTSHGSFGYETEVRIVRDATVETDRRRLERVLGNLVANAHRHGRAPVVLTVDGPVVTVSDRGPGYPAYLLEHGPARFRTEGGSKGHGLGLTIAVGQAAVIGADLRFLNARDGGAVARVTLRPPAGPRPGGTATDPP